MLKLSKLLILWCLLSQGFFLNAAPKKCVNGKHYINMHLGGRLGNQMFQVAAALSVAYDYNLEPVFPDLLHRKQEDIPLNHKIFFNSLNTTTPLVPASYTFTEDAHFVFVPIPFKRNMEVYGYFQSEKYFKHNKNKICAFFEASNDIKDYLQKKYADLLQHSNTVAIHMRAYKLENPNIENCFPFLSSKFFKKAANLFSDDALFVIFSDNIEWAENEMKNFKRPHIFIKNESHYHDFYLMSFCKHQIISTSSFSWWAAYLNKNPEKKIVAPFPWFTPISGHDSSHVLPEEWIKLPWQLPD